MPAPVPKFVGRYEVLERLAVGGMAELFKARAHGEHGFEKLIAIKKILPHLAADRSFVDMFIDEARLTAHLDHPHIVQVFELGTDADTPYIAMQFVQGLDVLGLLRECSRTQIRLPPELAAVIGRPITRGSAVEAREAVFGWTCLNDVSARDIQYAHGGQFFLGKSLDASCPIGPWIVTADELGDPQQLEVTARVNGEVKQHAETSDMIFPVADLIEWLSRGMTLERGDIIATGTPGGVGHFRTPPEYLRPGDVLESEVSRIGVLRNPVVAWAGAPA